MEFKYKAKKNLNEVVEGRVEMATIEAVLEDLQRKGLVPVSIEPVKNGAFQNNQKNESFGPPIGKWDNKNLILFTQKLYNLINSRVELLSALRLLETNSKNRTERLLLADIIKNIKDGLSFSGCLSRYKKYFPSLYINIIHTGETTGKLKDALSQLLDYLRRFDDLRTKVKQALAYPAFMTIVGIGTIFVMLTFVLPRLAEMFEDFQAQLPLPTLILINVSGFLKEYWMPIIISSGFLMLLLRLKNKSNSSVIGRLKYHVPIVKDILYKQSVASFSRSLSLLLRSGVNLLSALSDAGPIMGNPVHVNQLDLVRKDISEGMPFSDSLSKFKIFPDFFIQMVRVGEEGGRLDSVLGDIADSYEKEIESDLKTISALIEPAIILVLGLIIGAMVIAMLLPIFDINSLISG